MSSVAAVASSPASAYLMAGKILAANTAAKSLPTASAVPVADKVAISQAARDAFAAAETNSGTNATERKLDEIKARDALRRTPQDMEYLIANDKKFSAILDKENKGGSLTASEVDYMQKTGGFVNSFALLSPAEKDLYDQAIASGNKEAAAGISIIALTRTMGHMAGGAEGTTYDPINTEITAANVEKYFRHSVKDPSGKMQAQFQALIQFLQNNPAKPAAEHSATGAAQT